MNIPTYIYIDIIFIYIYMGLYGSYLDYQPFTMWDARPSRPSLQPSAVATPWQRNAAHRSVGRREHVEDVHGTQQGEQRGAGGQGNTLT